MRNARLLQKNQERHKVMVAVTEQSADAILVTDLESRVIIWNPSAHKLFRYGRDEMLGLSYRVLIAQEHEDLAKVQTLGDLNALVQRLSAS